MKSLIFVPVVILTLVFALTALGFAEKEERSGNFSTSRGTTGSFQTGPSGTSGINSTNATWNSSAGQGSMNRLSIADPDSKMAASATTINTATGQTIESQRVTAYDSDTNTIYTQATVTGPQGNSATVTKAIEPTGTGSRQTTGTYTTSTGGSGDFSSQSMTTVENNTLQTQSTLTGPNGNELNTQTALTPTEEGWVNSGSYETSAGGSGSFIGATVVTPTDSGTAVQHSNQIETENNTYSNSQTINTSSK